MTRIIHAELLRLVRRRTLLAAAGAAVLFAAVATLAVMSAADDAVTDPAARGATTVAELSTEGGATEVFAVGASFVGFLVFVTFIALMAGEFSGGTFRAMLLRDPHRLRVIVGKLLGALAVAAGVVAFAEVVTVALSFLVAPSQDIDTAAWSSLGGLEEAARDYLTVLGGVAGWAVFGTTLAVIFRSAPIALGVGFGWAGPFENIVVDSWDTGFRVFPGQVLGSLIQGGTSELALGRASVTAVAYAAVAAAVALTLVSRRDVTA